MKGYVTDIDKDTRENENFRKVLYTAAYMQLVVMSIRVGEEIGEEVHGQDQFLRIEAGEVMAILDGVEHPIRTGSVIVVPASTRHNIRNTSSTEALKLYSLYSPPHHEDGVIHATKEEAEADHEEFMGDTTEK